MAEILVSEQIILSIFILLQNSGSPNRPQDYIAS